MQRADIWTLRDDSYASKARPVVVVQNDKIEEFDSVILCLLTTYDSVELETRVKVIPNELNGLTRTSYVMTDKVVTVDRAMLGDFIGKVDAETMKEVDHQLAVMLGLV